MICYLDEEHKNDEIIIFDSMGFERYGVVVELFALVHEFYCVHVFRFF